MFWDVQKEAEAIVRRMVVTTRVAGFVVASLTHLMASLAVLFWQTSCLYPRCVQGTAFEVLRGAIRVPLFITPWLGLPSPDDDFHGGWALFGYLILNAMLAVLLYSALAAAARRGHVHWRISRSRASSACTAGRGT
jgi:hypothetical protein